MNTRFSTGSARQAQNPGMSLDFGYPWWLSYGYLPVVAFTGALGAIGYWRKWPLWLMLPIGLVVLWSAAAFGVMRFGIDVAGRATMPTQRFFRSGAGRVLDLGAGTGRSSIMVLEARPKATLVALDLFAESFDQHFGHSNSPQQMLMANLKAVGVADRATISKADMRELPFENGSFDALVSAYAIDHLGRNGIDKALAEAARVAKPGADFLLIVVANDGWVKFMFGPLAMHPGTRGAEWWSARLNEAGFDILETGSQPATLYVLARRR